MFTQVQNIQLKSALWQHWSMLNQSLSNWELVSLRKHWKRPTRWWDCGSAGCCVPTFTQARPRNITTWECAQLKRTLYYLHSHYFIHEQHSGAAVKCLLSCTWRLGASVNDHIKHRCADSVTLTMAWLLVTDGLVWVFLKDPLGFFPPHILYTKS